MSEPSQTPGNVVSGDTHRLSLDVEAGVAALSNLVRSTHREIPPEMIDDLAIAARAAWLGGVAACEHYDGDLEIEDKGVNDPVTAADYASNRAILAVLARDRPDDRILSEESPPPEERHRQGRLWVVDPLDGTKEFIAHNGEFSIMVGLAEAGTTVLGAVYQPAVDRLFAGFVSGGAWVVADAQQDVTARRLELPAIPEPKHPIRFVRSRSHPDERLQRLAAELGETVDVISGSVGIKCALVATGEADLYVHPVPFLKEWDTCAPEAVLRGAGGSVTDCSGTPLRYGKSDPRQPGGIFAATDAAWRYARPVVVEITAPLFDRDA
ncbi:MAG: 3'(2'),5'-bisphosphate nucleotidase CysQ [Gemmatimonadota bacterium]